MKASQDSGQTMQRLKVGMTGLALVLLLIGLASMVFSSASKTPAEEAATAQPDIVANLSFLNEGAAVEAPTEPLAELGVAPSTTTANTAASPEGAAPAQ